MLVRGKVRKVSVPVGGKFDICGYGSSVIIAETVHYVISGSFDFLFVLIVDISMWIFLGGHGYLRV